MPYREIIAVCSQNCTEHINAFDGQKAVLLVFNLMVHIVSTWLQGVSFLVTQDSVLKYQGSSLKTANLLNVSV
jgi:hypothetical protein